MQKFVVWIKQFYGASSPFGDLAGDIAKDDNFPQSNSYNILRDYLKHSEALDTFDNAWKHYNGQIDTKIAHHELGMKLDFARLLLMSIQCTPDTNELLRGNESSCLTKLIDNLSVIKSSMEDVIFNENHEWANTGVYYGNSEILDSLLDKTVMELNDIAKYKANNSDHI